MILVGKRFGQSAEYAEYSNFKPVIEKAKEACKNNGQNIADHFVDFHEMVSIGSGAERGFDDE
jgi:DNA-damage-inducible protein D